MAYFLRLELEDWQQFRAIDIEFHNRLTVLTGANGSGKTTILNLLGRHAGWNVPSLAVPVLTTTAGIIRFVTRLLGLSDRSESTIGTLTYDTKHPAGLLVPHDTSAAYQIAIQGQQEVSCFFLPSHRAVYRYQPVGQIPVTRIDKRQAFDRVSSSVRNRFMGGGGDNSPSYHMKEILIAWSIFGRGNPDMAADEELLSFYHGFQATLRLVLPPTLGFRRLAIRKAEVVAECETGEFLIDAFSGGLSAIIDLAWQVFMFGAGTDQGFTVLIDEVENHLHPVMQKRVLSDFLKAFPHVRFIVSTHSPLIVTSVRDAFVYALRYDTQRRVSATRLDVVNHAKTATQILDEVLGVSSTLPLWAEEDLQRIVDAFTSGPLDEQRFSELRRQLTKIGLGDYLPQALGKLLDSRTS